MSGFDGPSYSKEADFTRQELLFLVDLAEELREDAPAGRLAGRKIALVLEKTSTRTRAAF